MAYVKKEYLESDAVKQAQAAYQNQLSAKPGDYVSGYQDQISGLLNQLQNRKPFQYDLGTDALYQQYRDQYVRQGRQAMMDTMGQSAALTGGYGSSYAQTAGQQTYQNYLMGLNAQVPQLYALAMEKYRMDGDDLKDRYEMLNEQEKEAYSRYRDQLSDWNSDLERLYQQYIQERSFDYGIYTDEQDFAYGQYRDEVADQQWQTSFDYQKEQNQLAYEQWLQEFEYQKQQDELAYQQWLQEFQESQRRWEASQVKSASKGSGGSGSGTKVTTEDSQIAHSFVENMLNGAVSSRFDPERVISGSNVLTDAQKQEAQDYLKDILASGRMK